jgi:hypothetical protein
MESSHYQVECVWGIEGLERYPFEIDVLVWVDVLEENSELLSHIPSAQQDYVALIAGLHDSYAVADWIMNFQLEKQQRMHILMACAGAKDHSIADQLAAGAIIERLAEHGIDAMSPQAAVANAAFIGLKNATNHLISAFMRSNNQMIPDERLRVDEGLGLGAARVFFQPSSG